MLMRPDILVLGAGGRHGEAWMTGVLAGLEDAGALPFVDCEYLVGTSAGAVLAARLAAGQAPERPAAADGAPGREPPPNLIVGTATALAAPFALVGLRLAAPLSAAARAAALRMLPTSAGEAPDFREQFPPRRMRFDGRLRIAAVDRGSGRRVLFGAPRSPRATVAQALAASCAVPLMFAPVPIGGREYVDGALWSPTNADAAPAARDAQVLVLAPMASLHGPFSAAVRAASRAAMLLEVSALKARGARVRAVTPDRGSAAAIGAELMSHAGIEQTHAAGYRQGLAQRL